MSVMDSLILGLAARQGGGSGGCPYVAAEHDMVAIVERTIEKLHNESLTKIGSSGMRHCTALTEASLPNVTELGQYAFYQCTALKWVELPAVTSIGNYAFGNCSALEALILSNASGVCALSNANALTVSAIESGTGYVYVPAALLESYKTASVWSGFANQIRAIEDYPNISDPALADYQVAETLSV